MLSGVACEGVARQGAHLGVLAATYAVLDPGMGPVAGVEPCQIGVGLLGEPHSVVYNTHILRFRRVPPCTCRHAPTYPRNIRGSRRVTNRRSSSATIQLGHHDAKLAPGRRRWVPALAPRSSGSMAAKRPGPPWPFTGATLTLQMGTSPAGAPVRNRRPRSQGLHPACARRGSAVTELMRLTRRAPRRASPRHSPLPRRDAVVAEGLVSAGGLIQPRQRLWPCRRRRRTARASPSADPGLRSTPIGHDVPSLPSRTTARPRPRVSLGSRAAGAIAIGR